MRMTALTGVNRASECDVDRKPSLTIFPLFREILASPCYFAVGKYFPFYAEKCRVR
jgi:hypothetical protein